MRRRRPATSPSITCGVHLPAQHAADGRGDVGRIQRGGGHLVEERLEEVVVAAIDHRDPHRRPPQGRAPRTGRRSRRRRSPPGGATSLGGPAHACGAPARLELPLPCETHSAHRRARPHRVRGFAGPAGLVLRSTSRERRPLPADRQALLLPLGAPHRGHLRHHRGHPARLLHHRSRLVQPGPGHAGDRAPARRAAPRPPGLHRRRRPGVRAGGRHLGAARGGGRALQPALPARHALAVLRRERLRLRGRAGLAHPGGGRPRAT